MFWLTVIGSFAVGICIGAVSASRISASSSARIRELEQQIQELQQKHDSYRENVSDHFGMTAELVQEMTSSYRAVYQHLANGAQNLCSGDVADKLLPGATEPAFPEQPQPKLGKHPEERPSDGFQPPRDYAARKSANQPGALSEGFGLKSAATSFGAAGTEAPQATADGEEAARPAPDTSPGKSPDNSSESGPGNREAVATGQK